MKVRAYIYDTKELYYPTEDSKGKVSLVALAEFYTVLEGYRLKKRPFEITWSTGIDDIENREVFAGDRVELIYPEKRDKRLFPLKTEKGHIEYSDGCFTFISETIPGHERVLDPDMFSIRILNYAYTLNK